MLVVLVGFGALGLSKSFLLHDRDVLESYLVYVCMYVYSRLVRKYT